MAMEVSLSFKVRKSWEVEPASGLSDLFQNKTKQNKTSLVLSKQYDLFYELIY